MLRKNIRKVLEEVVSSYFDKEGLERSQDIYRLANQMGFDVRKVKFNSESQNLDGILLVDEDKHCIEGFNTNKIIGLNSNNDADNNRFTVAHELSHYIFEKMTQENYEDNVFLEEARVAHDDFRIRDLYEQMIDYMAASILMPQDDFKRRNNSLIKLGFSENDRVRKLSEIYGLPMSAVSKRIKEVA